LTFFLYFFWLVRVVCAERMGILTRNISSDINALILDYLTVAGYPRAAEKFSIEANLEPQQDSQSIAIRQQIQNAIHNGRIRTAIENINDLDPEVRVRRLQAPP
jgi:hypothetical protein